jgi:hypothetical protein
MKTKRMLSLLVLTLFMGSMVLFIGTNDGKMIESAQTEAQGFQVIGAHWGNATTNVGAGPGEEDVPLTISLQYLYPYEALDAQLDILLPGGFSTTSSPLTSQAANNATIYYPNSLQKGQVFEVETFLNLASNLSLSSYSFPTTILWSAILTNSSNAPEVSLEQFTRVGIGVLGDTKLDFSTSQIALTPGQVNNITFTLANSGSGNATNIATTISSGNSQQVSVLNQFPAVSSLSSGQSQTGSVELFVASSAAGASVSLTITLSYLDAYNNQQSNSQNLGLFVSTSSATSQLVFQSNKNSLTPGQINNVTLLATNEGTQSLENIATQVTSSSQAVSVLSQPDVISSLSPGSSASLGIGLFVSATSSNTAVTLAIASTFTVIGPNNTGSSSQNLGLYVSSQAGSSGNSSLTVTTLANQLLTGMTSQAVFSVKNIGSAPIFDPTFDLSVSSPLVVMSNSTYSLNDGEIAAGQSQIYEAGIASSPSATAGVYDGSLLVSYTNQYGISNSQTIQVGFVLTGTIESIIQDETVSQGTGNLTVSGSLLDEGTASAYYATITGASNSSSKGNVGPADYIGEIDPNTPVPFSTTVPYALRGSSEKLNVMLELTYKNSFGADQEATFNTTTTVSTSALAPPTTVSTGSGSDVALVQVALYVIVAVVVVAAVIGVIVVRRKRREMRVESGEETEEAKVV